MTEGPEPVFQDSIKVYHVIFADDTVATVKAHSASIAVDTARRVKRCQPVEVIVRNVDGRWARLQGAL